MQRNVQYIVFTTAYFIGFVDFGFARTRMSDKGVFTLGE